MAQSPPGAEDFGDFREQLIQHNVAAHYMPDTYTTDHQSYVEFRDEFGIHNSRAKSYSRAARFALHDSIYESIRIKPSDRESMSSIN